MTTTERKGGSIRTFTGGLFWPLDPRSSDVNVLDIAHALSNQCRFSGHTRFHYSVAQHSVYVSRLVEADGHAEHALWGLLHDASEAYLVDFPTPIKRSSGSEFYLAAEKSCMEAVRIHFDLSIEEPEIVHVMDKAMLRAEQKQLMQGAQAATEPTRVVANVEIERLTPEQAELGFMSRYVELMERTK